MGQKQSIKQDTETNHKTWHEMIGHEPKLKKKKKPIEHDT